MRELDRVLEAMLFLSADPVPVPELADAAQASEGEVVESLARLRENYAEGWRGIVLREVAGGFTLASDPVSEPAARRLLARPRTPPLTPAQAETLAIVAYLQPVSRKLFGLRTNDDLPDPSQWDPSPEEEGELRDRLLRAGEARAGVAPQADPAGTATD